MKKFDMRQINVETRERMEQIIDVLFPTGKPIKWTVPESDQAIVPPD